MVRGKHTQGVQGPHGIGMQGPSRGTLLGLECVDHLSVDALSVDHYQLALICLPE